MDKQTTSELRQIEAQLEQHRASWLKGGLSYQAYAANCQPLTSRQIQLWRQEEAIAADATPLSAQQTYDLLRDQPDAFLDWQQSVARAIES
ncbi:MAG: hypothetical protein ACAF41_12490 [Leptolyngbya sp. BL-A-14]